MSGPHAVCVHWFLLKSPACLPSFIKHIGRRGPAQPQVFSRLSTQIAPQGLLQHLRGQRFFFFFDFFWPSAKRTPSPLVSLTEGGRQLVTAHGPWWLETAEDGWPSGVETRRSGGTFTGARRFQAAPSRPSPLSPPARAQSNQSGASP